MIRFDEYWPPEDSGDGPQPGATDLPWPEDGRHAGEIVRVRDENFSWMEKHGADGRSLAVEVAIPRCRRVEAVVSVTWRGAIAAICRSARLLPPTRGEDWDCQQLVGRQVVIETVLGVAKSGKEFVRIDKWHAGPEPLPKVETATAPPAASATARKKPAAKSADDDDIPF